MSCCDKKNRSAYRSRGKFGWTWFCIKCGRPKSATKGEAAKLEAGGEG